MDARVPCSWHRPLYADRSSTILAINELWFPLTQEKKRSLLPHHAFQVGVHSPDSMFRSAE
jgi:hypothetical protein